MEISFLDQLIFWCAVGGVLAVCPALLCGIASYAIDDEDECPKIKDGNAMLLFGLAVGAFAVAFATSMLP